MNKNDIKSHTKNHSFSKTPSLAQVTSWIIFTTQALVFYIYVINAYQSDNIRMTMITLFTISFAALVFFGIYTGQNDPTDELVIAFKNKKIDTIVAHKTSGNKIFYCSSCQASVKQKSKHCRVCCNCSQQFDHHCIWLNVCIGGKNYRSFVITMVLTFTTFFFYILSICILTQELRVIQASTNTAGFIITWIVGIVIIVFQFLITNLIVLHIYLNYKGLSTYDFMLLRAQQKKREQEEDKNRRIVQKQKMARIKQQNEKKLSLKVVYPIRKDTIIVANQSSRIQSKQQLVQNDKYDKTIQKQKINSQSQLMVNTLKKKQLITKNNNQIHHRQDSDITDGIQQIESKNIYNQRINILNKINVNNINNHLQPDNQKGQTASVIKQIQSIRSNQQRKKPYISNKQLKPKLNKFFAMNASYDLLLNKNQCQQNNYDNDKTIQLNQEIQHYQDNLSIKSENKQKTKNNNKYINQFDRFKLFNNNKKKLTPIDDRYKVNNQMANKFEKDRQVNNIKQELNKQQKNKQGYSLYDDLSIKNREIKIQNKFNSSQKLKTQKSKITKQTKQRSN